MMPAQTSRAMKDSGIEWVGEIPAHWTVRPFYSFVSEVNHPNTGMKERNLLSLSYGRLVRKDIDRMEGLTPASYEGYNIIEANDIVFRLTDLQNDHTSLRSARSQERGIITSAYVTVRPQASPRFFEYLMRSYDTTKVFYGIGGGIRQSMKFADLKRLPVVVPPDDEMEEIASCLDRETTRIDTLIAKKTRFIKLLREKRQGLITHTVTKGLDAGVSMKDSGIEWVGEIPAHWTVRPFYSFVSEVNHPNTGMKERNLLSLSYGRLVRKDIDRMEGLTPASYEGYNIIEANDIVFRLTDLQNDHTSLRSARSQERGIITSAYVTVRPQASPRFFEYLMRSYDTTKVFYGIGGGIRQSMKFADLKRLPVVVPPDDEMEEIASCLDRETTRIDTLIAKTERSIELLREHRVSLITVAVTGKIDLHNAA